MDVRLGRKAHHVMDGETYYPRLTKHYDQCCDCGLTHRINYRVEDANGKQIKGAKLRVTTWRAERNTSAIRRGFKFEKDGGE